MASNNCANCPSKPVKARGLCVACYGRVLYWENPDKVKQQQDRWKAQHPDRVRETRRRSWAKNKGRYKSKMKEWYAKNSTKVREQRLGYYAKTREKQILQGRNGNFKRNYGISLAERDALIVAQNNCCAACGESFAGVRGKLAPFVHHDHKKSAPNYIAVLHARCNIALGQLNDDAALISKVAAFAQRIALEATGDIAA